MTKMFFFIRIIKQLINNFTDNSYLNEFKSSCVTRSHLLFPDSNERPPSPVENVEGGKVRHLTPFQPFYFSTMTHTVSEFINVHYEQSK